jgi:hypothetical protein
MKVNRLSQLESVACGSMRAHSAPMNKIPPTSVLPDISTLWLVG